MTLYFSEKTIEDDLLLELRKRFPRGKITSNMLEIKRADTIDNDMLIQHFECAVAKTKEAYKAAITLPIYMEYRIPSWIVQDEGQLWVNPQPDIKGFNEDNEELFVVEFHFYVDEKQMHKIPETSDTPIKEALIEEFIEIRHALLMGNEEPLDIFRKFYTGGETGKLKSKTAKYLNSILRYNE